MTNMPLLRRAALVPAAALAAGLLQGSPPAAGEAGGAVVLPLSEIAHLFGGSRDVFTAADGTVYYGKGVVVLPAIAFDSGSDRPTPTPELQAQIAELARALKIPVFRDSFFSIEGHTDSVGSAARNEDLSLRRARQVARILVEEHGVPPDMLAVCGRGECAPRAGLRLAPENSLNRRVEVVRLEGTAAILLGFRPPANPISPDGIPVVCGERRGRYP